MGIKKGQLVMARKGSAVQGEEAALPEEYGGMSLRSFPRAVGSKFALCENFVLGLSRKRNSGGFPLRNRGGLDPQGSCRGYLRTVVLKQFIVGHKWR